MSSYEQFQLEKYGNILPEYKYPFFNISEEDLITEEEERKIQAWEQYEFEKLISNQ